ncbi:MAG: hypothetical protein M5R40_23465 [Anaerolineae bacterium]|nr:hypothetical protein [Anaerolineae bacterium]
MITRPEIKRTAALLVVLCLLAVSAVGTGVAQETQPAAPSQPVITLRAVADDAVYEGVLAEYCWPTATGSLRCGTVPDAPEDSIVVEMGDDLEVVVESEAGLPESVTVRLADDPEEEPVADTTDWTVDLEPGVYEVLVDATFPDVNAYSFVSYRFTLEVSAPPTPTPTETPTEEPTEAPTEAPTEEPTEEATEAAEATEPAGTEPAEPVTPDETETPGAEATSEVTAEPTEEEMAGEEAVTPTVTLMPTQEIAEAEETEAPAETPTPSKPEPELPLTGPPPVMLQSGDVAFASLAVEYCWDNAAGERECPPGQPSDEGVELLGVPPQGAFLVVVDGPAPLAVSLALFASNGIDELARETRLGDALLLYSLPPATPGSYIFAVEAEWPEGIATYYFPVLILEPEPEPQG